MNRPYGHMWKKDCRAGTCPRRLLLSLCFCRYASSTKTLTTAEIS